VLIILTGCGYTLKPPVFSSYTMVATPQINNLTVKAGLEDILLEELSNQLRKTANFKIVPLTQAELLITCFIKNYEREPQTYTAEQEVIIYKINISCDVTISELSKEEPLQIFKGPITASATYETKFENEEQGIAKAMQKISEELLRKITASW
jgi:hypothetical protein